MHVLKMLTKWNVECIKSVFEVISCKVEFTLRRAAHAETVCVELTDTDLVAVSRAMYFTHVSHHRQLPSLTQAG